MAKLTTYWVQPFRRSGPARLARGDLRQYETEARARRAGEAAARRLGGAVVFAVRGDPELDAWDRPRHIASLGETASGIAHLKRAVAHANGLIPREAENSRWQDFTARAELNLAELLLAVGQVADASPVAASACARVNQFLARDPTAHQWRANRRDCLITRAQLALAAGNAAEGAALAANAVAAARTVHSTDPAAYAFALAKAHRLTGDAQRRSGNINGALAEWRAAVAALPKNAAAKPTELAEQQILLQRLGRTRDAAAIAARLRAVSYRHPTYLKDLTIA